jgi:uncharacterized protein YicC (UPF0701 family)
MITSMTGFGRRQGTYAETTVTIEVRSVNHRFLETSIRLCPWASRSHRGSPGGAWEWAITSV